MIVNFYKIDQYLRGYLYNNDTVKLLVTEVQSNTLIALDTGISVFYSLSWVMMSDLLVFDDNGTKQLKVNHNILL